MLSGLSEWKNSLSTLSKYKKISCGMKNKRYPNAIYAIFGLSEYKNYVIRFICMETKFIRKQNFGYPGYYYYPNKKILYPNTKNVLFECKICVLGYPGYPRYPTIYKKYVVRVQNVGYPGYPNTTNSLFGLF